ncbi:MAG: septal ring lytic transglycosylase RlpA family protein, partial [Solirubrobacteraceae bacterium]
AADPVGALTGLTAPTAPTAPIATYAAAATAAAAPASASTSGGAASSPARPVIVTSRLRVDGGERDVLAGASLAVRGRLLPAQPGRLVALEARSSHGWSIVARARTGRAGGFRLSYAPAGVAGQSLRVRFAGDRDNARSVDRAGSLTVFEPTVASWYDDGGTTACGFHAGLGVANRTLPCGTRVRLRYGGRDVTAVVDDRGPFVGGRDWDLNQSTAAALGFAGVGTVWASVS